MGDVEFEMLIILLPQPSQRWISGSAQFAPWIKTLSEIEVQKLLILFFYIHSSKIHDKVNILLLLTCSDNKCFVLGIWNEIESTGTLCFVAQCFKFLVVLLFWLVFVLLV